MPEESANPSDRNGAPAGVAERARRAEFERLFGEAKAKLWLIAAAITTDRVEADDVVQESAIVGLAKFDQFLAGTSFEHWMGQITRNLARNASRSAERRRRLHQSASRAEHGASARGAGGEAAADGSASVSAEWLVRGLARLDEDARTCLLLRTVGGHSYREIATITGLPEGTAMSHVHRSRQRLREMMGRGETNAENDGRAISMGSHRLASTEAFREGATG